MVCAIVLAAGTKGAQKVRDVVDQILKSPVRQILVVTFGEAEVAAALKGKRVAIVINPEREGDTLSSIRCGLRAMPGCEAVLIVPGDQPGIRAELIGQMIKIFETSGAEIVVPVYRGRRGHPILFSTEYCDEVQKKFEGVGLRGLLSAHPEKVHEMKVEEGLGDSGVEDRR
jgi:molybdenum cofactor cytidylyltransferase